MGTSCQLVRLRPSEVPAFRDEPIDVLRVIDGDAPGDRWVDLDKAWSDLLTAFEADDRGEELMAALIPGEPVFDESEHGGQAILFAAPDLVRSVAAALDALDPAALLSRWPKLRDEPDRSYVAAYFELRGIYRQAASDGDAIAIVIG